MDSIIPYEEGLVCQACGDEGFTNAFIYCVKCLGYVIHRYCLDVTTETYDEFVFWYCDDCEPAGPYKFVLPKVYPSGPNKEDPTSTAIISTIYHNKKLKKTHLKREKKKRKNVHLLAGNGEVSCPPNELEKLDTVPSRLNQCVVLGLPKAVSQKQSIESAQLASCSPVKESTLLTHEPSQPLKEDATRSLHVKTTPNKKKLKMKHKKKKKTVTLVAEEDKISSSTEATKTNDEFVLQTNSVLKEALVKSDSVPNQISPSAEKVVSQKQSAEADNNCSPLKENAKRKRDASSLTTETKKQKTLDPVEHSSCESSCTDSTVKIQEEGQNCEGKQSKPCHDTLVSDSVTEKELIKNPEEYNDRLETANKMRSELNIRVTTANGAPQLADLNSNVGDIHYQPARPVRDPVWRGSFNIVNTDYDLFEGFIGHLSSKACLKVYEEAKTLSSLLRLEMHPKNALWPKSFLESHPSDEKIALYFFPGDPKNERVFELLVHDMIDEELAMKTTSKNAELLIFASTLLPQPYWRFQGNYYMWGVFRGKRNESSSAVVQDVTVSNTSNNHMPERNEVNSGKDMLTTVKSVDSMSPQSPLSNYR